MIRRVGFGVYGDTYNALGKIIGDKNEITAVCAI